MSMNGEFVYALCVDVKELLGVIKKVQPAKGKDSNLSLSILTYKKENMNRCTITCCSDTMQAVATFYAQLNLLENRDDGKLVVVDKVLEKAVTVVMDSMLADVVATFSEIEDYIYFKVMNGVVIASNTVSSVPIPIKESGQVMINPKTEHLSLHMDREDLVSALKYVALGTDAGSSYGNSYGFKVEYDGEKAIMKGLAICNITVVTADIEASKVDREDYPDLCNRMPIIMLDSSKVDQILSVNEFDQVVVIIYFREGDTGAEVVQVNVKTQQSLYMLKPLVKSYPVAVLNSMNSAYEMKKFGFTVDTKKLKSALPVLGLGMNSGKDKSIEFHVFKDHITICDEGGLLKEDEYSLTNIKEVKSFLPEDEKEDDSTFLLKVQKTIKSLKPYDGPLTLSMTNTIVIFEGTDKRIRHGMAVCVSKKSTKAQTETADDCDETSEET